MPAVVIDGKVLCGSRVGESKDVREQKNEENNDEDSSSSPPPTTSLTVRNCHFKNLCIWDSCFSGGLPVGGTTVYRDARERERNTRDKNERQRSENEARIAEAAEKGEEVPETEEVRDDCDPVEALVVKTVGGKARLDGIVLSERMEGGGKEYALVVEDDSFEGKNGWEVGPFRKIEGGFIVFNL